jgi:hypothetical protein
MLFRITIGLVYGGFAVFSAYTTAQSLHRGHWIGAFALAIACAICMYIVVLANRGPQ